MVKGKRMEGGMIMRSKKSSHITLICLSIEISSV